MQHEISPRRSLSELIKKLHGGPFVKIALVAATIGQDPGVIDMTSEHI